MSSRVYPVVRDRHDVRDMKLARASHDVVLPSIFDLSHFLGPVKDQGDLGACTAFSWSSVREFLYRKYFQWEKSKLVAKDAMILAPLFLYYQERLLEGDTGVDNGAQSRTGAVVLNQFGCCLEYEDVYNPTLFEEAPTGEELTEALDYRSGAYHSIPDLQTLKSVICSGYVASIGISVYSSFESNQVALDGRVPIPGNNDQPLGGHETTPFGFDDEFVNEDGSRGAVHVLNSWGPGWGAKVGPTRKEPGGSFWLPYGYFTPELVMNMWVCHLGKPWVENPKPAVTPSKEEGFKGF